MKIAVVGAGGVGGYVAAMLATAGQEVYLVARGGNKEAIQRRGIRVEIGGKTLQAEVKQVSDDPAEFGERMACVLFCTKGYDLEEALLRSASMIGPETLLVPLGNGVANAEKIRMHYPENPVANGAVYIVSHLEAPGVVKVKGKGAYIVIGSDGGVSQEIQQLGEVLDRAGIKTKVSGEITTEVWKKFLLISAMATLTSCYDEPMGAVVKKRAKELDAILHEILAVGRAEGAKLKESDIEKAVDQVKRVPYDSPTSMWLDIKAGRKSELEALSGYVVKRGAEHGIPVPVMRRCYEELKGA